MAAPACSLPSPRGWCRAVRAMLWSLVIAFSIRSCDRCSFVGVFPCSYSNSRSAEFFGLCFMGKPGCSWPLPGLACSCPSPRGGSRADMIMRWGLGLALVMGCVGCKVHGTEVAWGVGSPPSCRPLLPACSFPSSVGWYRAGCARCSCCARSIMVGAVCCSVGMVAWGVEFHGGGGVSPSWIKLMCELSMVPADRSAAVVSPGWLFLRWEAMRPGFDWFGARGDCGWDASGAETGKLPGRCCAASV